MDLTRWPQQAIRFSKMLSRKASLRKVARETQSGYVKKSRGPQSRACAAAHLSGRSRCLRSRLTANSTPASTPTSAATVALTSTTAPAATPASVSYEVGRRTPHEGSVIWCHCCIDLARVRPSQGLSEHTLHKVLFDTQGRGIRHFAL